MTALAVTNKKIVCIFCGSFAFVTKQNDLKIVSCPHCGRDTELDTYQEMFGKWIDEIRKE